ncbi:transporter [Azoarcus sp. TTM-91]|uniref:transporter n=1 Tax=Azoarcus sp. TTM-91 TaxID=2691581 RepID=UPI00145CF14C|nr:transporter [Azoarcus sp. TTM-91]NMG32907.1 transporter [Azoarcus sp. TTM-91]
MHRSSCCGRGRSRPASLTLALLASLGLLAGGAGAAEIATDPGDYAALPPGTDLGILYLQHTERDAYYAGGDKLPGRFRLETDIGLLRWVHYARLGDYVIDPQLILPFGTVRLKTPFAGLSSTSASGVGDPLVGGTLWLVNQAEEKRWLGLSAFVSIPVGSYDDDKGPVNVGENRWKGIFQAGYVTALPANFMLDLIGEYAVYGENDDFLGMKRKQDPSYGLQAHLRYLFSPSTHAAVSYYRDYGGETKLDGVRQDDRLRNDRWLLTFATFVAPTVQLQAQYGQALRVENGARESSRFNLRLLKVF